MNSTRGNLRFNKVIEILICFGGLGVLGLNVLPLRQNRSLQNTLAPSDCCRSSFRRSCGSRTGWPYRASNVAVPGFQAPHHYFFSGLSGLSGQSGEMDAAHRHLATKGGPGALGKPRSRRYHEGLLPETWHTHVRRPGRPTSQNLCATRSRKSSEYRVGWGRGQSRESVGGTLGPGRLEHDVCIFGRTGRDSFPSPGRGWRTHNRLRVRAIAKARQELQVILRSQERRNRKC